MLPESVIWLAGTDFFVKRLYRYTPPAITTASNIKMTMRRFIASNFVTRQRATCLWIAEVLTNIFLSAAGSPRQREFRVDVARDSEDVILLSAGQCILRRGDFNVVGNTGLKTILGKFQ